MGRNHQFIRKIIGWAGVKRDIENLQTHTRRITTNTKAQEVVTLFYHLLANTNYLTATAYEVLILKKSPKAVATKQKITTNAVYKNVSMQYRRIERFMPDDLFELIKNADANEAKLDYYFMILNQLIQQYRINVERQVSDLFTFEIEGAAEIDHQFNFKLSENDFADLVTLLQMGVKSYQEMVLEQIDGRLLGYIVYLLQGDSHNLTERDMQRKRYLEEQWCFTR